MGDAGDIADGRLEVVKIDTIVLQLNQFHILELFSKYLTCPVIQRKCGRDDAKTGSLRGENGIGGQAQSGHDCRKRKNADFHLISPGLDNDFKAV